MSTTSRVLVRRGGGELVDGDGDGREVSIDELASDLGRGGRFRVVDEATGRRCTYEVLAAMRVRLAEAADPLLESLLAQLPSGRRDA